MKEYIVSIPITGVAVITVQADSKQEAIALGLDNVSMNNIEDWAPVQKIVGGNVFYGLLNEAEADEQ